MIAPASDATARARIAILHEEIVTIDFVNSLYWNKGEALTRAERAEYHQRLERLAEIRRELAQLRSKRR